MPRSHEADCNAKNSPSRLLLLSLFIYLFSLRVIREKRTTPWRPSLSFMGAPHHRWTPVTVLLKIGGCKADNILPLDLVIGLSTLRAGLFIVMVEDRSRRPQAASPIVQARQFFRRPAFITRFTLSTQAYRLQSLSV